MTTINKHYEILRDKLSEIGAQSAGAQGTFERAKMEMNRAYVDDRISYDEWLLLMEYLALIRARK